MSPTQSDLVDEPSVFLRVTLPNALDQPPLTLAVTGVSPVEVACWTAQSEGPLEISICAPTLPDAELGVRTRAGTSLSRPSAVAGFDHPVRLLSSRPVILGCGRHRLVCEEHRPDSLELAEVFGGAVDTASRTLFDVWLQRALAGRGVAVLHGAAVRVRSHGLLAVGGRHVGKSTIAAAAIVGGGSVVSDDWLFAAVTRDGSVVVAPGRTELAFRRPTVDVLPEEIRRRLVPAQGTASDRWALDPTTTDPWHAVALIPTSIWRVSIDRRLGTSRLQRINQADTWAALAHSTSAVFLSGVFDRERSSLLRLLHRLVTDCPGFRLRLGRDLLADPATTLDRLVSEVDAAGLGIV
jgi:hypothetical protein